MAETEPQQCQENKESEAFAVFMKVVLWIDFLPSKLFRPMPGQLHQVVPVNGSSTRNILG